MNKWIWLIWISVLVFPVSAQEYDESSDYEIMLKKAESTAPEDGRVVLETGRVMTLVNGEILPGGCWDYANAVYDRAGYAYGKREQIFKTAKAGPYADIGQIKSGDWLYYVNHSYGDIEHSAIFVDWIDYEGKIGLMLSYGGENRRQPARYLPYDLSGVYGITRPNAKLGQKTTTSKSGAATTNTAKSTSQSKIVTDTAKTTSVKTISGVMSNGMKVESLKFGLNVNKMEIVGEGTSFTADAGKVYCWMRVSGGQGRYVKVKWYYNGQSIGDVQLDIKFNPMRTYAYRTISGRTGSWSVEVVDPSGTVLHAAQFKVH